MITRHVDKLKMPIGTMAEPTIHGTEDNEATGVNWFDNDDVGFVTVGQHSLRFLNAGWIYSRSNVSNFTNSPMLRLDRTQVPTVGTRTSIEFSANNAILDMGSIRSNHRVTNSFSLQFHTVNAAVPNTLSALHLDYNNNVGFNVQNPQYRVHQSDEGDTLHANLLDANSLAAISSSQTRGSFINLISSNDQNTTRGGIKGIKTKGTVVSPTAVTDTNYTLSLLGAGYDGATALATAGIHFQVMGTPSTNVMPQGIIFETGPTTSRIERGRILPNGN